MIDNRNFRCVIYNNIDWMKIYCGVTRKIDKNIKNKVDDNISLITWMNVRNRVNDNIFHNLNFKDMYKFFKVNKEFKDSILKSLTS